MYPEIGKLFALLTCTLFAGTLHFFGHVEKNNLPLSTNLKPLDYVLTFVVTESETFSTASLRVICVEETSQIVLNSKYLDIATVKVKKILQLLPYLETEYVHISRKYEFEQSESYIIQLKTPLKANDMIVIEFVYKILTFSSNRHNAIVKYNYARNPDEKEKWFAVTKSSAINAKRLFPCIDEAGWKVPVTVRIAHHKSLKSLSNTYENDMDNTSLYSHGKKQFVTENFHKTDPLSPFSIGFVIGDFRSTEVTDHSSSKTIRIWSDEAVINKMIFARDTALKVFIFYYEYFWSIHGTNKIDIVALPNYNRVDEFRYGLITLEESLITYEEKPTNLTIRKLTQVRRAQISLQLCDAFAHQYFGPQTTFLNWNENWLNMGFALFFRDSCLKEILKDEETGIIDINLLESFIRVTEYDNTNFQPERPVPPDNFMNLKNLFKDTLLAERAHFVVRYMSSILGKEILHDCVKNYIVNFRFQALDFKKLWSTCVEEAENSDLASIPDLHLTINKLVEQKKSPFIVMMRLQDKILIRLMRRYDQADERRIIPLNFLMGGTEISDLNEETVRPAKGIPRFLLDTSGISVNISPKNWIIFNFGLDVLCRIYYDFMTLELIQKTLFNPTEYKMIPVLSRIHFISNLFELAELQTEFVEMNPHTSSANISEKKDANSGPPQLKYNYYDVFNTLYYLKHEESSLPFILALHKFGEIRSRLFKAEADVYSKFETYVKDILSIRFGDRLTLNGDYSSKKYANYYFEKVSVKAVCTFGIEDYVNDSMELYMAWSKEGHIYNPIPIEHREVIYCTIIRKNSDLTWNHIRQTYDKNNPRNDNKLILKALACTSDTDKLKRYLEWSLDPEKIAPADRFTVFESFLSNKDSYQYFFKIENLFNYMRDIIIMYDEDLPNLYRYFQKLFETVTTEDDMLNIMRLRSFIKDDPKNIDAYLETSMQIGRNNISWLKDFTKQMKATAKVMQKQLYFSRTPVVAEKWYRKSGSDILKFMENLYLKAHLSRFERKNRITSIVKKEEIVEK